MAEEKEAYSDHSEKDGDGSKGSFGWCYARELLRETQAVGGHIQRGESIVPPLRSLGFFFHGRNARQLRESGGCEEEPEPQWR